MSTAETVIKLCQFFYHLFESQIYSYHYLLKLTSITLIVICKNEQIFITYELNMTNNRILECTKFILSIIIMFHCTYICYTNNGIYIYNKL